MAWSPVYGGSDKQSETSSLEVVATTGYQFTQNGVILEKLVKLDAFQRAPSESKLCQTCAAIDLMKMRRAVVGHLVVVYPPHKTLSYLIANGIKRFHNLKHALMEEKVDWNKHLPLILSAGRRRMSINISGSGIRYLNIFAYPGTYFTFGLYFQEMNLDSSSDDSSDSSTPAMLEVYMGMPTHLYPDTNGHFHLLNEWIQSCIKTHKRCRFDKHEPPLPTRVLDVTYPLRLEQKSNRYGRYTTLSHCWGGHQPFITTKKNLESRLESIDFSELPKSFRDAVFATRSLGIRYIWTDSLCIVQDDPADWDHEAVLTGTIFSNSYCTIAATSAKNDTIGFLAPRQPQPCVRLHNPQPRDNDALTLFVNSLEEPEIEVTNACLNKRAWVLQERMLSPRILHFTSQRTYWECDSLFCAEEFDDSEGSIRRLLSFHNNDQGPMASTTPEGWFDLVDHYSQCGLTFDKDKLIAISGLVNRVGQFTNVGYATGLWEDCVHRGLLWCPQQKPLRSLTNLKLPSWSWAGYSGAIQHLQIYYFYPSPDMRLRSTISGSTIIKTAIVKTPDPGLTLGTFKTKDPNPPCSELRWPTRYRNLYDGEGAEIGWVSFDRDREGHHSLQNIGWVVVAKNPDWEFMSPDKWSFCVLLVKPSKSGNTFQRRGIGMIFGGNGWLRKSEKMPIILV